MAIWYTDVAQAQIQGNNFPGQTGLLSGITTLPFVQNDPLREGPSEILATYTWTGTEAANDIINIGIIQSGQQLDPNGHVSSGATAPATTLTMALGDNDQGVAPAGVPTGGLPITNPTAVQSNPTGVTAPTWVTGTVYTAGQVVIDPGSTPVNATYTCILGLTSATQPHSDSSHWVANSTRYSTSINTAGAAGNVAAVPPAIATGFNPYFVNGDCWFQALLLTVTTPVAGAVSVFRFYWNANN